MIFAEMEYQSGYSDFHSELVTFIESNFSTVKSGLQGDSWIGIVEGNDKVAIDTFSSMKHQVKSESSNSQLMNTVIQTLSRKYKLHVYDGTELEPHEDI